jgi:hypothetical protein
MQNLTIDVLVYLTPIVEEISSRLTEAGFAFDSKKHLFVRGEVNVRIGYIPHANGDVLPSITIGNMPRMIVSKADMEQLVNIAASYS